ncbi:MAG: FMN-binding protein [Ruminococcus sp.]|nr:FMN-binding protein [Ruminococcus sp.]
MLFLTALILSAAFVLLCGGLLKKYPVPFYIAAFVVSAGAAAATWLNIREIPESVRFFMGLFTRGAFATALWCAVMWGGAFPNGSRAVKKLMPIRGELSITAAFLTLGHNIGYGKTYFNMLFTNAQRMNSGQLAASILTIAMLVIMIPLTVMSFPKVRRRMKPKLWKNIQRTAYLFYAMLYIHVMLLTFPLAQRGRDGYLFSVGVYSAVFIGYSYFRIRKAVIKKFSDKGRIIMNGAAVLPIAAIVLIIAVGRPEKTDIPKNDEVRQTVTATVPETTSETTEVTAVSESRTEISSTEVSETTATSETTTQTETTAAAEEDEEVPEDDNSEENVEESEETPVEEEPQPEPEPQYVYNNGDYSASAYGYDGEVFVTVTIENDVITSITGHTDESDPWYYDSAAGQVIPDIIASQSTSVDAYSGATYSSEAIKSAVQAALELARK